MADLMSKIFSLGVGAVLVTKDKAEDLVNDLIKRGEVGQEEGKNMVQDLMERGEKSRREMRAEIDRMIRDLVSGMNLPAKKDVDDLRNEIELLKKSKPSESEIYELRAEITELKRKLSVQETGAR